MTLHDLILPFWPAIALWEYRMGLWALHREPYEQSAVRSVSWIDLMEWTTFFKVGHPVLVGSLFLALPAAVVVYIGLRGVLIRSHARRADEAGQNAELTELRKARGWGGGVVE